MCAVRHSFSEEGNFLIVGCYLNEYVSVKYGYSSFAYHCLVKNLDTQITEDYECSKKFLVTFHVGDRLCGINCYYSDDISCNDMIYGAGFADDFDYFDRFDYVTSNFESLYDTVDETLERNVLYV